MSRGLPGFNRPRARNVSSRPPLAFNSRGGGLTPAGILALSPAAWFRLGIGVTIATGVSQWDDQSGNGRHLKQATGASQPALQGDNSILFDGVAHNLKCDAFTFAQPETIYLLMRQVTWTSNETICDGDTTVNTMRIFQDTTTPQISQHAGNAAANGNTALTVNTYSVIAAVFNGASSVLQVNGTSVSGASPGGNNAGGFILGARPTLAEFSNIQVKEVILFSSAHNASTRTRVMAYLNKVGSL